MSRIVEPRLLFGKDVWKKIVADGRETIFLLSGQRKLVRLGSSMTPILTMLPILPVGPGGVRPVTVAILMRNASKALESKLAVDG